MFFWWKIYTFLAHFTRNITDKNMHSIKQLIKLLEDIILYFERLAKSRYPHFLPQRISYSVKANNFIWAKRKTNQRTSDIKTDD